MYSINSESPGLEGVMMITQDLIDSIKNQKAVFFCGAGLSASTPRERGFLGGRELAKHMAKKLLGRTMEDEEPLDLKQIAQEVIWAKNDRRGPLNDYLRKVFADPAIKPLRAHRYLAYLGCNVITTNYDTLIERALSEAGKLCNTVVREKDLTRMQDVNVVKIHGCITDVDRIVITEQNYYDWLISDSVIKTLVRLWFLQYPIVFIGFSLSDPNLRQLYYGLHRRFGEALKAAYAIFKEEPDNYDMRFIRKQGIEIITQDATAFLEELVEKVVLTRDIDEYDNPIACAEIYKYWIHAGSEPRTPTDLANLEDTPDKTQISRILALLELPSNYQQLVKNGTIGYHCAYEVVKIRKELKKRGQLEKRDEEVYKWAETGPPVTEAREILKQLKAGKDWDELEH
jgi:hypothetical protein